jgi:hypothetical protein
MLRLGQVFRALSDSPGSAPRNRWTFSGTAGSKSPPRRFDIRLECKQKLVAGPITAFSAPSWRTWKAPGAARPSSSPTLGISSEAPSQSTKRGLDKRRKNGLPFSVKKILHFVKTLLEQEQVLFGTGVGNFLSEKVPLGRFYSSRPSSRSRHEIVLG